jgi:hypothetical protein
VRRIKLSVWLKKHTQRELSYQTGITQGSISAMLNSPRQIFVVETPDGNVRLLEHKWLSR